MLKVVISVIIIFGFSFTFWSLIGLLRFIIEFILKKINFSKNGNGAVITQVKPNLVDNYQPGIFEVAVVMAAHNEQSVINDSLEALEKIIPPHNVFVANDGSLDKTGEIARAYGANVLDIYPKRGKAGALAAALEHFNIYDQYKYVVFIDADTRLRADYLANGMPLFKDDKIAAVAGYARSQWKNNIFIAYRCRVWLIIQTFFRFGMSWKYTNVNMIVPGFASMYRTRVLRQINIAKQGLVIEDFNMTFELQKKKLGKIAHYPSITGYTQDPDTFKSYCHQIKRWNLGFWQTVKANGVWSSFFWLNLIIYLAEIILVGFVMLIFPIFILYFILAIIFNSYGLITADKLAAAYVMLDWFLILFIFDYFYTIITAIVNRRPALPFYGPTMLFFRWLDAYYLFTGFFLTYTTTSSGVWTPPKRWQSAERQA